MLPGELQAQYGSDPGYKNFLSWIAAGGKHGTLGGLTPNEAVVRTVNLPWGENKAYDAAGNEVSMYRALRPGEVSPYGPAGGAPSAPDYDPAKSAAAFVPWGFTSKGIAGKPQPSGWTGYGGGSAAAPAAPSASPSVTTALATQSPVGTPSPTYNAFLASLAAPPVETEEERQARLLKAAGYGANLAS